ncbi:unnamed protein product, partial [Prorocentrum cordatum]
VQAQLEAPRGEFTRQLEGARQEARAEVQGQLQEAATKTRRLREANQKLESEVQRSIGSIPQATERMSDKITQGVKSQQSIQHGLALCDNQGIGKPTTFGDQQDKFQAWSRKFINFVVGVYVESFRAVLRCAAEQDHPVTMAVAKDEYELTIENLEEKVNQLYTALSGTTEDGSESNDLVTGAPDGNGLKAWRRLNRRWDPLTGARKRTILRGTISPPKCTMDEVSSPLEKWMEQVARHERSRDDQGNLMFIPDDVQAAALEMLVPTELENHLMLNKHRLPGFQEAYDEVVMIVEARTGVKIKEPSIKDGGWVKGPNDMDVGSRAARGQWGPSGKGRGGKTGRGKAAGSLDELEPEAELAAVDMGCFDIAGSAHGELHISPLSDENGAWLKFNWDSRAAISAFPRSFAPKGLTGNGNTYKIASSELVPDEGSIRVKAEDEFGTLRSLSGWVANVHKPLVSAGQAAGAGQCSYLSRTGGWVFHERRPIENNIEKLMETEAAKQDQKMPVHREQGVYNFYIKKGQHGTVAPLEEDDITGKSTGELMKLIRDMRSQGEQPVHDAELAEEGEEQLRPKLLKAPHEPSQLEIDEHEATGHAVYRNWCKICIAARAVGQPHQKAPEEDETAAPVICSNYGFMGQEDGETLPMLVIKDRRSNKGAATFVEKKGG